MKNIFFYTLFTFLLILSSVHTFAQCAVCTKTAQQLGEGPAKGLNAAIIYLMIIPLSLIFIIAYRWYKREQKVSKQKS